MTDKNVISQSPLFKDSPLSIASLDEKILLAKEEELKNRNYLKKAGIIGIILSAIVFAVMLYNVSNSPFAYILYIFCSIYLVGTPWFCLFLIKYTRYSIFFSETVKWEKSSVEQNKMCEALLTREEMNHWSDYTKKLQEYGRGFRNYEVDEIKKDWKTTFSNSQTS